MRGVATVLLILMAACTSVAEDTTTAPPLADSSTTSTMTPPTPTTADECVDRDGDGVLRTRRGFVCPPHLKTWELSGGQARQPITDIHLPGTYTLRTFTHPLRFTRVDSYTSAGEHPQAVVFDVGLLYDFWWVPAANTDQTRKVYSLAIHETMARYTELQPDGFPDSWEWAVNLAVTDRVVGGFPAAVTTFNTKCVSDPETMCWFSLPGIERWTAVDDMTIALVVVDLPNGPFTIVVEASSDFDAYWSEIALPILDSIEFLDP